MSTARSSASLLPPAWVVTLAVCAFALWLLIQLKEVVVLLVVGYCIAYAINPMLRLMQRHRIRRGLGVIVVFALGVLIVFILALTALPVVAREYEKLLQNLPDYLATAKANALAILARFGKHVPGETAGEVESAWSSLLPAVNAQTIEQLLGGMSVALLSGYSLTLTIVNLFLLPFIVFYLAVGFEELHFHALKLFPPEHRAWAAKTAREIDSYVSAFLHAQFTVCTILFMLYAAGLRLIGVELWLLLAVISGFGEMVPYVGVVSGLALSSLMALVTFGAFPPLLMVWLLYAAVQLIQSSIITPKILGDKVGLSPLLIILALFTGGKLFGLLGIFLAIPAAAALRVLLRQAHRELLARH